MDDVNNWDGTEAYQLKECYDLAVQFVKLDIAKDVLREKSKKIDFPKTYASEQTNAKYVETEMQIISEALYELTLEGFVASESTGFKYAYKINSLPESAEKEYLMALLALRNGTNETQRLDAMRHISVALSYSPDDPRYIALANVLQDVDK